MKRGYDRRDVEFPAPLRVEVPAKIKPSRHFSTQIRAKELNTIFARNVGIHIFGEAIFPRTYPQHTTITITINTSR